MVASLMLKKPLVVNVNNNGKFKVADKTMAISDVPAVRYRFDSKVWVENPKEAIECVNRHKEKFNLSVHIIELDFNEMMNPERVKEISGAFLEDAVFLYLDVTDDVVANGTLGESLLEDIRRLQGNWIDRVMLRDLSNTLYTVVANKLKDEVAAAMGIKTSMIGVCNSPLSVGDNCCLTALRARELAAKYGKSADMVVPSANHEGKNTSSCGCIRYIEIAEDTPVVEIKVPGASKKAKKEPDKIGVETTDGEQMFMNLPQGEETEVKEKKPKKKVSSKAVKPW